MARTQNDRKFTSFAVDDWRQLMQLADLVSLVLDHQESKANIHSVRGQAEVGDHLLAIVEELAVICIDRGLGNEVAQALRRLRMPISSTSCASAPQTEAGSLHSSE
jgi:hypothetical protein